MVPKFIQENYLHVTPFAAKGQFKNIMANLKFDEFGFKQFTFIIVHLHWFETARCFRARIFCSYL